MIVDLDVLKMHLRVDSDDEDVIISAYADAATTRVAQWIGRPVYAVASELPAEGQPGYDPYQIIADAVIRVAIMKWVALMYGLERSGGGGTEESAVPPRDIRELLSGHRIFHRDIAIELVDP